MKATQVMNECSQMDETVRCSIYYQTAFIHFCKNEWTSCLELLDKAKKLILTVCVNKSWRKFVFLEGVCNYYKSDFTLAVRAFSSVVDSALNDGDMYYETIGNIWSCMCVLSSSGVSENKHACACSVVTRGNNVELFLQLRML